MSGLCSWARVSSGHCTAARCWRWFHRIARSRVPARGVPRRAPGLPGEASARRSRRRASWSRCRDARAATASPTGRRDHAARGRRRGRGHRSFVPVHRDPPPWSRDGSVRPNTALHAGSTSRCSGQRPRGERSSNARRSPTCCSPAPPSAEPGGRTEVRELVPGGTSMKVFVTGGTRAIGRFVIPALATPATRSTALGEKRRQGHVARTARCPSGRGLVVRLEALDRCVRRPRRGCQPRDGDPADEGCPEGVRLGDEHAGSGTEGSRRGRRCRPRRGRSEPRPGVDHLHVRGRRRQMVGRERSDRSAARHRRGGGGRGERDALHESGRTGIVLRFGFFYGAGSAHTDEFIRFARRVSVRSRVIRTRTSRRSTSRMRHQRWSPRSMRRQARTTCGRRTADEEGVREGGGGRSRETRRGSSSRDGSPVSPARRPRC